MEKTILIADDSPRDLEELRHLLEPHFDLVVAENGYEALQKFHEVGLSGLDGAVLDYQMMGEGDIDFYELDFYSNPPEKFYGDKVAIQIREEGFQGPIIIHSSMAEDLKHRLRILKDVYCHNKGDDGQKMIDFLNQYLR